MENQKVWIPDAEQGFILGKIIDIGYGEALVESIGPKRIKAKYNLDRVYIADDYDNNDFDDNCAMMHLNEASLLNNIKIRYKKDKIYTYVANILIAVNPYFEIHDLYSENTILEYQGKSIGTMPPHVFAIADKAFRDMKSMKQSQSVIVSGESGSGKTESTKYLLRYLCESCGSTAGPLEQKILDANPILEAFGNAKTTRNNNSSRFGKFIEVHFDSAFQLVGGYISHYLLEKSRICVQSHEERNYHIFYLLCAGAPESLRQKLNIMNPDNFHYLNKGCRQYFTTLLSERKLQRDQISEEHSMKGGLQDPILDDVEDFAKVDQALSRLGLSEDRKLEIYTLIAAVLHLGNIFFEDNPEDTTEGCTVSLESEETVKTVSLLLGVDNYELRQALTSKIVMTGRGGTKGTAIMVPLKVYEAINARDALAKAVYSNLFDYIVKTINRSIPFAVSSYYIGVLDIAGFEYFTVNSFEQFCINYCNEKLQQFFNERILKDEQELYKKEGLDVQKIHFIDNQDCIDLIEAKRKGIFGLLDEESKLPSHSSSHFTSEVHRNWNGHFRLAFPRASPLKQHREFRDDEGFLIRHFAGAVCYQTGQFLEKNNDALHMSLECLVQESESEFLQTLFLPKTNALPKSGKLTFDSVGLKFKTQLGELMKKLRSTGTSFIRCIKPNENMSEHEFEGANVLSQLQCSGMASVLELMQTGYPSRAVFSDLYNMYDEYMNDDFKRLEPRVFFRILLHALGMTDKDYSFGITKLFFRPGKFSEFDTIMQSEPLSLKVVLLQVKKWLIIHRWKISQYCVLSVIKLKNKIIYRRENLIILQKSVRMYLIKKQHQPRYKTILKINELEGIVNSMEAVILQLRSDKTSNKEKLKDIQKKIVSARKQIKIDYNISKEKLKQIHSKLMKKTNTLMTELNRKMTEQRNMEEQEKLKKINEGIEKEKMKKRTEKKKKKEEESIKKRKAEMENRRKAEDEMRRQFEEEERISIEMLRVEQEKDEIRLKNQYEQERRDHELACRLAKESNTEIEELSNRKPVEKLKALGSGRMYDLSSWKYTELRDTINTSCNLELLESCKHEFHRRLKVYHEWKAKNKRADAVAVYKRAPKSIVQEASRSEVLSGVIADSNRKIDNTQRYFRIPFSKPSLMGGSSEIPASNHININEKKGWWYAHFDGQYVVRQMELHPDKQAILLIAGKNDMEMCELTLEETGLTRKKGAEILAHEFEKEWERQGGRTYLSPSQRAAR